MLKLLFDEDFNNTIIRGMRLRLPDAEIVRAQDVGLRTKDDATILEWAATNGYVLVSHDARTMPDHFATRLASGATSLGVILVKKSMPIAQAIDWLILVMSASLPDDYTDKIFRLPTD